jgi:hypothetical protein
MSVRTFAIASSSNTTDDFRRAASGVFVPTSPLNNRTGVTSAPVLTGTGSFTCTVGPFSCVVNGTSNSQQSSYWAALDQAATVTINAASTQARIDLISLQIQDNVYDGSGQHQGVILYTAGTPGSGVAPTAPANSISLWTVPVAANASSVNFSSATAVFPYTAAAGGIVPARSAADKPAVASAVQYRHRLDVTPAVGGVSPLECSLDGATWYPVYDPAAVYGTWTNCGVGSGFNVNIQPQYRTAPGNRIELRGAIVANTTVASGSAALTGIPAPSRQASMALPNPGQAAYSLIFNGATQLVASTQANGSTFPTNLILGFDGLSYTLS